MPETLLHPTSPGHTVGTPAVRRPGLGVPLLVAVSFAVAAPLSVLLAAGGGARHPGLVLAVLCAGALVVGCVAHPAASGVIGLVFWLFFNGFVAHRAGVLGWDGRADMIRLASLVGAGAAGSVLGLLRRLRPAWPRRFRRASLQPFTPELPSARHPWFWN